MLITLRQWILHKFLYEDHIGMIPWSNSNMRNLANSSQISAKSDQVQMQGQQSRQHHTILIILCGPFFCCSIH